MHTTRWLFKTFTNLVLKPNGLDSNFSRNLTKTMLTCYALSSSLKRLNVRPDSVWLKRPKIECQKSMHLYWTFLSINIISRPVTQNHDLMSERLNLWKHSTFVIQFLLYFVLFSTWISLWIIIVNFHWCEQIIFRYRLPL